MKQIIFALLFVLFLSSCKHEKTLPYIGKTEVVDGKKIHYTVPDFTFKNQNGELISQEDYKGSIYIASFFFTSCPTICPKVMRNMTKIYEKFNNNDKVKLASFTLDPKRDTIQKLKAYADNLEISTPKWNLMTGRKKDLHDLNRAYFNIVVDDPRAPGGINHSGKILLIDKNRNIRAFAEGTEDNEVDRFIDDIERLLQEYNTSK